MRNRSLSLVTALMLGASLLAACGGSDDEGDAAAFCNLMVDDRDIETPEQVEEAMKDLKAAAPSEIKDDIQVMIDGVKAIEDLDATDPSKVAELEEFGKKLEEASDNLDAWGELNCEGSDEE